MLRISEQIIWLPVWDDILTPLYTDPGVNISYDILTQGSIYRNNILTPSRYFDPPPPLDNIWNIFVYYEQLLNVVYCYIYEIWEDSSGAGLPK